MTDQIKFFENKLSFEMDPSDLFDAINRGEKIRPLDARKVDGFNIEHIPGAINIPHREMNEQSTQHLEKAVLYVVYCDGIGCNASTKGALNMARLGFKVKELIGGITWWKFDGYATEGPNAMSGQPLTCTCRSIRTPKTGQRRSCNMFGTARKKDSEWLPLDRKE